MRKAALFFVSMLYLLTLSGCRPIHGPINMEKGEAVFQNTVTSLFAALDERNHEEIYGLFSPAVKRKDKDLKEQIDKLLSIYPGPTDEIGWNGLVSGGASYERGKHSKHAFSRFPIRSGNTYYWCYLDLMYENTFDEQQIGITQMDFYTADEFCMIFYDTDKQFVEITGLNVHADVAIDKEIRCIESVPFMFDASTEPLNIAEVRNFFKNSDSFSEFTRQFGHPNAENLSVCYVLQTEGDRPRYLNIVVVGDTICSATVVNDLEYIETIYKDGQ